MTFADAVREILVEASAAPERPTPGSLAERISRQAERYLDRVRFDPAQYVRHPVLLWDDWEVMIIGWEAGQLENELGREDWIVEDPRPDELFAPDAEALWEHVLTRKGGTFALVARMPLNPSLN